MLTHTTFNARISCGATDNMVAQRLVSNKKEHRTMFQLLLAEGV
jgi:hypothetical protein